MASDLDELLRFIDTSGVQTSQGSYVSAENLRKWVAERQRVALEDAGRLQPKTMVQAKRMAARDEEIFPSRQGPEFPDAGSSITATETSTHE